MHQSVMSFKSNLLKMFWYTYPIVLNHFSILKHLPISNYSDTDRGASAKAPKHADDARGHHVDAEKRYGSRPRLSSWSDHHRPQLPLGPPRSLPHT